jgi:hypothetical protein
MSFEVKEKADNLGGPFDDRGCQLRQVTWPEGKSLNRYMTTALAFKRVDG